jgi:hypothetical protein
MQTFWPMLSNADVTQHASSRALLDAASDPSVTLYVTSQILCDLYSLITNRAWLL